MAGMGEDRRLLIFLGTNCALGITAGWLLLAALIHANIGGLGDLLFGNGLEFTALLLVAAGFAVTFGSLAMGTAVFLLPRD